VLIAVQIASKACRDALFLSHHGADHLPAIMGGSALLAVMAVLFVARMFSRQGPTRVVPRVLILSALIFLSEWLLFSWYPGFVAVLLYLHVATFGAVTISGFWSVVTERFDPHTAKKSIAQISAGAALGGVLGGLLADRIAAVVGIGPVLLTLAVFSLVSSSLVSRVGTRVSGEVQELTTARSGLGLLRRETHLRDIGLVVTLVGVSASLLDYAFKAEAARVIRTEAELVSFFALFYTAAGLITFGVQTTLCQRLLKHCGVGLSLVLLPLTVLTGGLVGTAWTRLWTLSLIRGSESVISHSIYRSSYELLYSPVAEHIKRPTKTLIDVGCSRLGDAAGALLVVALLNLEPSRVISHAVLLSAVASAFTIAIMFRVRRGYVASLVRRLRAGALRLSESSLLPGATPETSELDRRSILQITLDPWFDDQLSDLVIRAMLGEDQRLRGAALELLDEMVPVALREKVAKVSRWNNTAPCREVTKREKVDLLLASMRSLHLDAGPSPFESASSRVPRA